MRETEDNLKIISNFPKLLIAENERKSSLRMQIQSLICSDENNGDDNEMSSVLSCKWLVIVSSCLFISLISWDIVGDKEGWDGGIWVPLCGLGMLMLLILINYFYCTRWMNLDFSKFVFMKEMIIAT